MEWHQLTTGEQLQHLAAEDAASGSDKTGIPPCQQYAVL